MNLKEIISVLLAIPLLITLVYLALMFSNCSAKQDSNCYMNVAMSGIQTLINEATFWPNLLNWANQYGIIAVILIILGYIWLEGNKKR